MFLLAVLALFTGALDPGRLADWHLPVGVTASSEQQGILLRSGSGAPASARARFEVEVPDGWAGRAVRQEIDVTSRSPLVWSGEIWIDQLDAEGNVLPETVADHRWTTHMRPPGRLVRYRNSGTIHRRAKRLRLDVELRRPAISHDASGRPISDPADRDPSIFISHLAVVPDDSKPGVNPDFFAPGVSGEAGDFAFVCGGMYGNAFSYQTHTRGAWSNGVQFRNEADLAFPSGAGTLEAWFRPDWKAVAQAGAQGRPVTLFQGYQGYTSLKRHPWRKSLLDLAYEPGSKTLSLFISDWAGHDFSADFRQVEIPDGKWTHLALQWEPHREAKVFIDGKCAGTLPLERFEPVPISNPDEPNPNDLWITELFVAAPCQKVKDIETVSPAASNPTFCGAVDALRASTGLRYRGDFVPARRFVADPATRALFSFDRSYDGCQGDGFGFVPGTVYASRDRHSQSAPKAPFSRASTFDLLNYKRLPSAAEFRQARRSKRVVRSVIPGERFSVETGACAIPDFVEIANDGNVPLVHPILVADGRVDPRSYADIAASLNLDGMTDREKADVLFQYVLSASDYFVNRQVRFRDGTDVGHCVCNDALVMLNAYCGFECGYLNNLAANLFVISAGCPAAQAAGYGHSFQQVFFDGRDNLYDVARQRYFTLFDNVTPASLADIEDQPNIIFRTGIPPNNYLRKGTRVRGGHGANDPRYQEASAQTLNPGERLRICFGNDGRMNNLHYWPKRGRYTGFRLGPDEYDYTERIHADSADSVIYRRDRFFPEYASSFTCFDGVPSAGNPAFCLVGEDSFCYRVRGNCPVVWGDYAARGRDGKAIALSLSTDGGATFRPLPRGSGGASSIEYLLRARDGYLVRIAAPIGEVVRFRAVTQRQMNARAYPGWPRSCRTAYTFKADGAAPARVTVAWREPAKEISVDGGAYSGAIPGFERQLVAFDPSDGISLPVGGASASARAVPHGRVRARIENGRLSVSYDPGASPLMPRGDDCRDAEEEFPCFAAVDIVDGDAVRTLTFVIQPEIRMIPAADAQPLGGAILKPAGGDSPQPRMWCAKRGDGAVFGCGKMPQGEYAVFALVRFPCGTGGYDTAFLMDDPKGGGAHIVAAPVNPTADYLFAPFGPGTGRSRWKWDAGYRPDLQLPYNGWIIRTFAAPGDGLFRVRLNRDLPGGAEIAALLVVRAPGLEARADLRRMLFGLNCDPAHVVSDDKGKDGDR